MQDCEFFEGPLQFRHLRLERGVLLFQTTQSFCFLGSTKATGFSHQWGVRFLGVALNGRRQDATTSQFILQVVQSRFDPRILVQRRLGEAALFGNFSARKKASVDQLKKVFVRLTRNPGCEDLDVLLGNLFTVGHLDHQYPANGQAIGDPRKGDRGTNSETQRHLVHDPSCPNFPLSSDPLICCEPFEKRCRPRGIHDDVVAKPGKIQYSLLFDIGRHRLRKVFEQREQRLAGLGVL